MTETVKQNLQPYIATSIICQHKNDRAVQIHKKFDTSYAFKI